MHSCTPKDKIKTTPDTPTPLSNSHGISVVGNGRVRHLSRYSLAYFQAQLITIHLRHKGREIKDRFSVTKAYGKV